MKIKNIESFFLNTLLIISIAGVLLITVSDIVLFPEDTLSIAIAAAILSACIIAYLVKGSHPTVAVLIVTCVALAAMSYQRLTVPNTTTTLSVVLIVGFIFSVMLKGRLMWVMHGVAFAILNTVFVLHLPDAVTAAITYSTLYFILTYATAVLKTNYDRIHQHLTDQNAELAEKSNQIAAQNERLLQVQHNLNALNTDLEKAVSERTARIRLQNDILLRYSYTNAHHLRGPVARLLGLASIYKLDPNIDPDFFVQKMVDQAHQIDTVISRINIELDSANGLDSGNAGNLF